LSSFCFTAKRAPRTPHPAPRTSHPAKLLFVLSLSFFLFACGSDNDGLTDTTPPVEPTVDISATNNSTPTISGTAEAGSTVSVVVGYASYSLTADDTGAWTLDTATNPLNIEQGTSYIEQGVTTTDAVDGAGNATVSGTVDTATVGEYTLSYSATDAAGNAATAVTRTVNVTADVTAPVITVTGANPLNIEQGTTYTEQGAPPLLMRWMELEQPQAQLIPQQ